MSRKVIAAGAAAAVLAAGVSAVGVQQATKDSGSCQKPLTMLSSEQTAAVGALEVYISTNIAPKVKQPADLSWESVDMYPTVKPALISVNIALGTNYGNMKVYHVKLVRDCQGGDWTVVEFKPVAA